MHLIVFNIRAIYIFLCFKVSLMWLISRNTLVVNQLVNIIIIIFFFAFSADMEISSVTARQISSYLVFANIFRMTDGQSALWSLLLASKNGKTVSQICILCFFKAPIVVSVLSGHAWKFSYNSRDQGLDITAGSLLMKDIALSTPHTTWSL